MRKSLTILILVIITSACATTSNYEKRLRSWNGQDINRLIQTWGIPSATYTSPDGSKIYEFDSQAGTVARSTYNRYTGIRTYAVNLECKTTFITNSAGIIQRWRWQGNACRSR